eukprot:scaffold1596_cov302-Pinguiococcus_pyrenoidosus.AAC.18
MREHLSGHLSAVHESSVLANELSANRRDNRRSIAFRFRRLGGGRSAVRRHGKIGTGRACLEPSACAQASLCPILPPAQHHFADGHLGRIRAVL